MPIGNDSLLNVAMISLASRATASERALQDHDPIHEVGR